MYRYILSLFSMIAFYLFDEEGTFNDLSEIQYAIFRGCAVVVSAILVGVFILYLETHGHKSTGGILQFFWLFDKVYPFFRSRGL